MTTSERVNCSTWCTYNSNQSHLIALWCGAERTRRFPKQAELQASVISGQDGAQSSHIGYRGAVVRWWRQLLPKCSVKPAHVFIVRVFEEVLILSGKKRIDNKRYIVNKTLQEGKSDFLIVL
jgi:hypothetical protein